MFDIGFSELLLVAIIGLVVLGPQRLPVAVRTVAGWIRAMRSMAANVQNELSQELKLQELQETLKKLKRKRVWKLFLLNLKSRWMTCVMLLCLYKVVIRQQPMMSNLS